MKVKYGKEVQYKMLVRNTDFVFYLLTRMIDSVNHQDKMAVVVVMVEKEDMLVYIIAHVMCALWH